MRSSRMAVNSLAAALFIVVGATPLMAQGTARRPVLRDRVEDVLDRREDRRDRLEDRRDRREDLRDRLEDRRDARHNGGLRDT